MILQFNAIELRRLNFQDIEMLRQWRNDSAIQQHMFYQKHISKDEQVNWFKSLSDNDYYFIIYKNDEALGMIHLNQLVENQDSAYAGLFIYSSKYIASPIPIYASLALLRFAFEELKLDTVYAKVRNDNTKAIQYNEFLGFKMQDNGEMVLLQADYLIKTKSIINRIKKGTE